jgi:FkbM family methyltransferase
MANLKRELLSAVNGLLPASVSYDNYGRRWKIPNVRRSMDRLMRPGRDALTGVWVRKYVPSADLIVDIGANVGQSLILYLSLYPEARYVGFEPNPISSAVLCRLIALNELADARAYTAAIGPTFRTMDLFVGRRRPDDPSATLVAGCHADIENRSAVAAIAAPLQDLVPDLELSSRSIVKIDVEGFEADVLESLGDLAQARPVVVSEVLPQWADDRARKNAVRRVHDWVRGHGYSIVAIGHGAVESVALDWHRYLFVPAELGR